jgi:hypothetical protein
MQKIRREELALLCPQQKKEKSNMETQLLEAINGKTVKTASLKNDHLHLEFFDGTKLEIFISARTVKVEDHGGSDPDGDFDYEYTVTELKFNLS